MFVRDLLSFLSTIEIEIFYLKIHYLNSEFLQYQEMGLGSLSFTFSTSNLVRHIFQRSTKVIYFVVVVDTVINKDKKKL